MITSSKLFVNATLSLSAILTVFAGCGFQLNRNQVQLPDNAKTIAISKIENRSYSPGSNITLRDLLVEKFAQSSIPVTTPQVADLDLSFIIESNQVIRNDYSLVDGQQTYEFVFAVSGRLKVINNIKQTVFLNDVQVAGAYSLISETDGLSQLDSDDGEYEAIVDLSDKIIAKFTQSF